MKKINNPLVVASRLVHRGVDDAKAGRAQIEFAFDFIAGRKAFTGFSGGFLKIRRVQPGEQQNVSILCLSGSFTCGFAIVAPVKKV